MVIVSKQENFKGHNYTSGKVTTQGLMDTLYGRLEANMLLPFGQGMWPAFWMMPNTNACWPLAGEIDIMENLGQQDTIYGTYHFSTQCGTNGQSGGWTNTTTFSTEYHLYSVIWDSESITWMVDNVPYFSLNQSTQLPLPTTIPFYIIFNTAVGGDWGGYPNPSTKFPQYFYIDYVRVYKKSN
eukprot:gene837-1044_t